MRSIKKLALAAAAGAAFALVLAPSSAFGAKGIVGFFGGTGVQGGQFSLNAGGPGGVAVNESGTGGAAAGDVYVVDRGNNRVQQFSASGAFVRAFGLNVGGPGVNICTVAASCVAGTASAAAGGMSAPQGVAIDQTTGNVYVTDQGNRRVDIFSAEGLFQGAFGWKVQVTGAAEELQFCTVVTGCQAGSTGSKAGQFGATIGLPAVSPVNGDLLVANPTGRRVDQFAPALTGGVITGVSFVRGYGWGAATGAAEFQICTAICTAPGATGANLGQFGTNSPSALTLDSAGRVYAIDGGNKRVQKFEADGTPFAPFASAQLNGTAPSGIAVNTANGHVLATKPCTKALCGGDPPFSTEQRAFEFDAGGNLLEPMLAGLGINSAGGLAFNSASGLAYMTTSWTEAKRGVFVLGTLVPPTATIDPVTTFAGTTATFSGQVNPQDFETGYHFEYSTDGANWTRVPATDVMLPGDSAPHAVSVEAQGLTGSQKYKVRLVATKPLGAGSGTSAVTEFTTTAAAPAIAAPTFSFVTATGATLQGTVNPQNQPTTYQFEYGTAPCAGNPCASVPVPAASAGSGNAPVAVQQAISGLQPGTTYHFRLVAANGSGTTEGPEASFTTNLGEVDGSGCANAALRIGFSALLPDCRAYEQVSPIDKNDSDATYGPQGAGANPVTASPIAPSGDLVSFSSFASFAGNPAAQLVNQYLSTRGPAGWSTAGISPPRTAPAVAAVDSRSTFVGFEGNLARMAAVGWSEPRQFSLLRRNQDGSFDRVADGNMENQPLFAGASADFSRIVYQGAETASGGALYEWSGGVSTPVSVPPNNEPPGKVPPVEAVPGASLGPFGPAWGRFMSDDGTRIYWQARNVPGLNGIYLSQEVAPTGQRSSTDITLSQCTTGKVGEPGPGGNCAPSGTSVGGRFQTASSDGSLALFTSPRELTNDATTGTSFEGSDLYRYDARTDTLTDLAPHAAEPNGAVVVGVLGASDDLSHVYFAANGVLASGATAPTTPCKTFGNKVGNCNLYLWHNGAISFVAGLSQPDSALWDTINPQPLAHSQLTQTSADGRHLLFLSSTATSQVIPGSTYDNAGRREAYLYDADSGEVTCVSCDPTGAPASVDTAFGQVQGGQPNAFAIYRNMSADGGRVFFETTAPLLARDSNGVRDVYAWEAEGSGSCTSGAQNGGCVYLVSTGRGNGPSFFQNTTPSGNDALFATRQQLVGQDTDELVDLYDARVGGGLASQNPPPAPSPCLGDGCKPVAPGPPPPPQLGSSGFEGPGNPKPKRHKPKKARCQGKAKKTQGKQAKTSKKAKGKCVRKSHPSAKRHSTGKRG